mgnify:CR=1 FL=1
MADESNDKIIATTASRAAAKVTIWVTGIVFFVMGSAILGAGKMIFDGVLLKIDHAVEQLDKDRATDIANLNARFTDLSGRLSDLSGDLRQIRNEQTSRTERLALLEAENKAFSKAMSDITPKLNRISDDVVAIKTQLGLRPQPPRDLGRIPMLWHF